MHRVTYNTTWLSMSMTCRTYYPMVSIYIAYSWTRSVFVYTCCSCMHCTCRVVDCAFVWCNCWYWLGRRSMFPVVVVVYAISPDDMLCDHTAYITLDSWLHANDWYWSLQVHNNVTNDHQIKYGWYVELWTDLLYILDVDVDVNTKHRLIHIVSFKTKIM